MGEDKGFKKGDRVEITGGRKGVGVKGEVFWTGPNKYGPGERLGVRGDDGQTYWATDAEVAPSSSKPAEDPGITYQRGDRVRFVVDGNETVGEVFWTGQSRGGPGQRLGVRVDGVEDPTWIDARFVQADDGPTPSHGAGPDSGSPYGGSPYAGSPYADAPDDEMPADYAAPMGLDDLPPAPPMDDDLVDAYARDQDDFDG